MQSKRMGEIELLSVFRMKEQNSEYFLQLLKISDQGCTFLLCWQDEKIHQGILKLDSNDIFDVDPKLIGLEKLDTVPAWVQSLYADPVEYLN